MSIKKYLTTAPFHDIIKYSSDKAYARENVAFTGTPRKHPYDPKKIILISDPLSANTVFYEFKLSQITHVEELSRQALENGESIQLVKIWIKKGSLALRYEPFIVENTINYLEDSSF